MLDKTLEQSLPMRIAILTDVHANLPALEVAIKEIERANCDAIYHLGDAIAIGPYPSECLDILLNTPKMHLIMGNHDAWFAHGLPTPQPAWMSDGELAHQSWTHAKLEPALRATIAQWPYIIQETFVGLRVTFLHYGLTDTKTDFLSIIRDPMPSDLDAMFANTPSDLIFYGHHHPASDITGRSRYVNPGALGCYCEPLARFIVLEIEPGGHYRLTKWAIPYDDGPLFAAFVSRNVPEREFICRAFFGRD